MLGFSLKSGTERRTAALSVCFHKVRLYIAFWTDSKNRLSVNFPCLTDRPSSVHGALCCHLGYRALELTPLTHA